MDANLQAHIAFHLTGNRAGTHLDSIAEPRLVPALLAEYQDLCSLRYDFPLVLLDKPAGGHCVEPMSGLIDDILEQSATGAEADRIRQHVLRLEAGIRTRVANGVQGSFSELWDIVAAALSDRDELVADSLSRARLALCIDGAVLDCDVDLPYRLLSRAWGISLDQRAAQFNEIVARLIQRLTDILKADFQGSREGRTAENLRASFGNGPMDAFDFEAMSGILGGSAATTQLPGSRRQRLEELLSVLHSQRFYATPSSAGDVYAFTFEDCASALEAYRKRLPRAVELARAIAIGELEVTGEYDEARHELLFESFGSNGLDAEYQAMFPDYLVRLAAGGMRAQEQELLFEILSADLPFKVLVQTDDVLEESEIGDGHLALSLRSRSLASTAMGLTGVFVLQSPSSALLHLRHEIRSGLDGSGPALFSIFSGSSAARAGSSSYLVAAAALESRAFPVFVYDPTAGHDWASRFSIAGNPQPEQDWPLNGFSYQDQACQAVSGRVPFSLVDFVSIDPRYSRHFARVAQEEWSDALVPATDVVDRARREKVDQVPSLLMVDAEDALHRVIVDELVIREARRCRSMWHSLQELGGIHNSHAERLLAREEAVWQDRLQERLAVPSQEGTDAADAAPGPAVGTPPESVQVELEADVERSSDEAYIETARCSTCNECTQINKAMFVYNENQQAYIADIAAGTFAQLVEAAESCQVSVIHPGRPRDPNEPGLEELLKRAGLFD